MIAARFLPLPLLLGGCGFLSAGEDPRVIAFRGGNGYWPENSRMAIASAVLQPWDGIHVDLAVTADEVAILHRAPWLSSELCTWKSEDGSAVGDPLGEQEIRIQDYTFEYLQDNFRCGAIADKRHDEAELLADSVLSFDEALGYFGSNSGYELHFNVVHEPGDTPEPEILARAILDPWYNAGLTNAWFVSAPDEETIAAFDQRTADLGRAGQLQTAIQWPKAWADEAPAGAELGNELGQSLGLVDPVRAARAANADGVALPYTMLDRAMARKIRGADLSVQALDVRRKAVLHTLERWPLDSIVTSYPEPAP